MQVQIDIGFDQLLQIDKALPAGQLQQLKAAIGRDLKQNQNPDLETLLLNDPTATKKQLETIAKNRRAIHRAFSLRSLLPLERPFKQKCRNKTLKNRYDDTLNFRLFFLT